MDRNTLDSGFSRCARLVALRKESVDRNKEQRILFLNMLLSLSARRAWIEIQLASLKLFG